MVRQTGGDGVSVKTALLTDAFEKKRGPRTGEPAKWGAVSGR